MKKVQVCTRDGEGNAIICDLKFKSTHRCRKHYQQWYRRQKICKASGCRRIQAAHYYCRIHEPLALLTRSYELREQTIQRFAQSVEPDWETGCWQWVGAINENGYGLSQASGSWLAHRFSYMWFIGGHEPRRVLDHLCNNRTCVRPDHLWAIRNTLNVKLQHFRELAGRLPYWQDSRGIHDTTRSDAWAKGQGLPYGESAPFGRDGLAPQPVEVHQLVPHLPRAARLLHPAWDNSQHKRVRPATAKPGDFQLAA